MSFNDDFSLNNKRLSFINDLPTNSSITIKNFTFFLFDSFSFNSSLSFINYTDTINDNFISTPTFTKFNNSIFKVISHSKESFLLPDNSSIINLNKITIADSSDLLRQLSFYYQRFFFNFDSSDIWNLDISISKFIIPRLEFLKSINQSWFSPSSNSFIPSSPIIDSILSGFYLYINKDLSSWSIDDSSSFNNSLSLLSTHFSDLWF